MTPPTPHGHCARHAGKNGFCTQIGNDWFTSFATRPTKSRLDFLDLLRAGHTSDVLNNAACRYMRGHSLLAALIAPLAVGPETQFADRAAWLANLDRFGLAGLDVTPGIRFRSPPRENLGAAFNRRNIGAMAWS
jgi:hypothetical protein